MKVLLYGRLTDAIDRQVELDAPDGYSVAELRHRLAGDFPAAAEVLNRSRAFLAGRLVGDEQFVGATDRVEFLPPVSGG